MESQESSGQRLLNLPEGDSTVCSGHFNSQFQERKSPRQADNELKRGTLVGGAYRVLSKLGKGGMGCVYRVRHEVLEKDFALKVLTEQDAENQNWLRFQAEAKVIAKLDHPNIVKVYNLGLHEGILPFYAMDLLEGEGLDSVLSRLGPLPLSDLIPIIEQVADGLFYAHRHGIVHRDIKPANIMLVVENDDRPTVKLLDFGIAKQSGIETLANQGLTAPGEIFGSPLYMSPEQCTGRKVDTRSDVYSLGCAIFESLTGKLPFQGENAFITISMHQSQTPPTLKAASGKDFPEGIEHLVARCLKKRPDDRYQNMQDLAVDLKRIEQGKGLQPIYLNSIKDGRLENLGSGRVTMRQTLKFTAVENEEEDTSQPERKKAAKVLISAGIVTALACALGISLMLYRPLKNFNAKGAALTDAPRTAPQAKNAAQKKTQAKETSQPAPVEEPKDLITAKNIAPESKVVDPKAEVDLKDSNVYDLGLTSESIENLRYTGQRFGPSLSENKKEKTFSFIPGVKIGKLACRTKNAKGEIFYSRNIACKDTVSVPADASILFIAHPNVCIDSRAITGFDADALWGISLIELKANVNELMPNIAKLTGLRYFNASETNLSDQSIEYLSKLTKLEELEIKKTKITLEKLASLKPLKNLQVLNVKELPGSYSQLLEKLRNSRNIRILKIQGKASDRDIDNLATLQNLEELDLNRSELTDQQLAKLKSLKKLRRLTLLRVALTPASLTTFQNHFSKLESLAVCFPRESWTKNDWIKLKTIIPNTRYTEVMEAEDWQKLGLPKSLR